MNRNIFRFISIVGKILLLGIVMTMPGCFHDSEPTPNPTVDHCESCNTASCIVPGITSLLSRTAPTLDPLGLTDTNIAEVSQKLLSSTTVTIAAEDSFLNIISIINDDVVRLASELDTGSLASPAITILRDGAVVLDCVDFAIGFNLVGLQTPGNANFAGHFGECTIDPSKSVFGEFAYSVITNEGSPFSGGAFNQQSETLFADFCIREGIDRFCLTGDIGFNYYSTSTPSVFEEISGNRLTATLNEIPLSLVSYSLAKETFTDNTFSINGSGLLEIPNVEGNVTFFIVTPLEGNANGEIIAGILELTGSNGSNAQITVLDASNIEIQLDANGDGMFVQIPAVFSNSNAKQLNTSNKSIISDPKLQQAQTTIDKSQYLKADRVPANSIEHVIHISVDGLSPFAITTLDELELNNFYYMRNNGAITDNARTDESFAYTLPNHITQLTGRSVLSTKGHGWLYNDDEGLSLTLHEVHGSYISSIFDVVHDHGLSTAFYVSKEKFQLLDNSWNEVNGANDNDGPDNGKDKIDQYVFNSDVTSLVSTFLEDFNTKRFNYTLLHLRLPDSAGHATTWSLDPNSEYMNAVRNIDVELGRILNLLTNDAELLNNTVIILTADHGGIFGENFHLLLRSENLLDSGIVPFYVFGANYPTGDLYVQNSNSAVNPGESHPYFFELEQPIRNGDAANLSAKLLGLPDVPGSKMKAIQLPESFNAIAHPATDDNGACNI